MYFFFKKAAVLFEVFCRKVAKGDETVLRQGVERAESFSPHPAYVAKPGRILRGPMLEGSRERPWSARLSPGVPLLAVRPWTSYLTFPGLNFPGFL